ncbi:MAG: DUF2764 family protein [Spirochaetota bacterium]
MSQYYFLVASLPLLTYENKDAAEPSEFLETLADHLPQEELELLTSATIDAPLDVSRSGQRTIDRWRDFERGLRNALVELRAPGASVEASRYLRLDEAGHDNTDPAEIAEGSREAFAQESPLSGEDQLNRVRWHFLDDLEVGHFFDFDRIVIYYLRLQLLARRRLFTRANGEERFARINETIMNEYYQEQSE